MYYGFMAGRVSMGVPMFVVLSAIALPLTIGFARGFAAVFEFPFLRHRSWSSWRAVFARTAARGSNVSSGRGRHRAW